MFCVLASGFAWRALATESGVSEWSASHRSAVRLLGAGDPDGSVGLAGVEVRLDPGYLTYWRSPGDAGVAPTFDFASSANVADVTVDYPAPRKLDEAGSEAFGYEDDVVFPLHVVRKDVAKPATLALTLDYAVCATQCLPARARLSLPLRAEGSADAVAQVTAALAKVPRASAVGAPGVPAILGLALVPSADKPVIQVTARASAESAQLFVEAPEGWYLQAGEAAQAGGGAVSFAVAVLERPDAGDLVTVPLRLTLVDASGAVEVATRMPPGPEQPTP